MANTMLEMPASTSCAIDQSCCGDADTKVVEEKSCTLKPSEMPERVARWKSLFAMVLSREIKSESAKFRFQDTIHLRTELEELIKLERVCCAHVSWKLQRVTDYQILILSCEEKALQPLLRVLTPSSMTTENEGVTL